MQVLEQTPRFGGAIVRLVQQGGGENVLTNPDLPLTPIQRGMGFHQFVDPRSGSTLNRSSPRCRNRWSRTCCATPGAALSPGTAGETCCPTSNGPRRSPPLARRSQCTFGPMAKPARCTTTPACWPRPWSNAWRGSSSSCCVRSRRAPNSPSGRSRCWKKWPRWSEQLSPISAG